MCAKVEKMGYHCRSNHISHAIIRRIDLVFTQPCFLVSKIKLGQADVGTKKNYLNWFAIINHVHYVDCCTEFCVPH